MNMNEIAARLDRICESIEKGASWESAAHLRNRTIGSLRALAREVTKPEAATTPPEKEGQS